jgi:hypothetical protein
MNKPAIRIISVLIIVGLVGLSCKKTPAVNNPPTITALNLPDSVTAGNDETCYCTATDPDGDPMSYNWTCSSGALWSTTGSAVVWTAPDTSGVATITVIVRDSSGASDTASGTVTVKSITTTIIDWDGSVAAGDAQLWTINIPAGYTVSGSFSVAGQDVTFLVLDSTNYDGWRFSQSYDALVKVDSSAGSNFSAVVPTMGFYHFILDNTYNVSADTAVHLFVQTASP